MKIEVFEIKSKKNAIYRELLEQYRTNPEVKKLLEVNIFPSELVLAGDFELITILDHVVGTFKLIKVYLVKDTDTDTFLWVIGKFAKDGTINMFPLLEKQSKTLQLKIRKVLVEKGILIKKQPKVPLHGQ
jgi:hypothetical protein